MKKTLASLLVAASMGLALLLKWSLPALDLEHYVGPDEGEVVENVLEMMKTGYYHQRHPGYPGLHFYIQMIPAAAHVRLSGAASVRDLPRADFYRLARWVTLLAGWATAGVVYLAGRGRFGLWPSATAASLVAISPLVFRVSSAVSPDLMLMLFGALALWLILAASDEPSRARFLAAGIAVGLATAVKYTGALFAVPYLFLLRRSFLRGALGLVAAGVAFAVASPYTILDWRTALSGITTHTEYYRAVPAQPIVSLARFLFMDGMGIAGTAAAALGLFFALKKKEKPGLLLASFPTVYFLVFALFTRAYPRHALVMMPAVALLAARGLQALPAQWMPFSALLLVSPLLATFRLGAAARRPTPAARAAEWIAENLPRGSRILEDQMTPSLDPRTYAVHRLEVEEAIFVGNFDWVLYSGYPPGLSLSGLRLVRTFDPEGSLGRSRIALYQVPAREALMGLTLARDQASTEIVAGELAPFGAGWEKAEGDVRLSRGSTSEIFFTLDEQARLSVTLTLAAAAGDAHVTVVANGRPVGFVELPGAEPLDYAVTIQAEKGLNRLDLDYRETVRVNRRLKEGAVRFFSLRLSR